METFYGRKDVIDQLSSLWKKRVSSLVTCRGRRRIGKSTLIEHFARLSGARFIKIEGLKPRPKMGNAEQLANFAAQLSAQTGAEETPPANWLSAFVRLDRELTGKGRMVVLLDEVSWMGQYDITFSGTLKIAWDNYFKKHDRLIFVICGSVSTWIKENVIDDGAFYGRRSLDIVVRELAMDECVRFWGKAASRIDHREIVDVLSITGGVPRYLEEIDPGATADENIRKLCFQPKSILREDFDEMFSDVITRSPTFTAQVLRTLLHESHTAAEISVMLEVGRNGHISEALEQLEESGLIRVEIGKNPKTGEDVKERRYRLSDNYARFYLKYVEPVKAVVDRGSYVFGTLEALDGWEGVKGLAFENLVINNVRSLLPKLGLGSSLVTSIAPFRRAGSKVRKDGVQIDLLVQTHRSVCLVEIKRKREIGREVIDEMIERVRRFPRKDDVSVRTALIYEGHLAPIVEADGYFDAIIPFDDLLRI